MAEVGRNEPCPCGSGKKYKKCCGMNNVLQLGRRLTEDEIVLFEEEILSFVKTPMKEMGTWLDETIGELYEGEEPDYVSALAWHLHLWAIFCVPLKRGETLFERFLGEKGTKYPAGVRIALQSWSKSVPSIYEVLAYESDQVALVQSIFDDSETRVGFAQENLPEIGSLVIGLLIQGEPYDRFFVSHLEVTPPNVDAFMSELNDDMEADDSRGNDFMREHFPLVADTALFLEDDDFHHLAIDDLEWESEPQRNVAELFEQSAVDDCPKEMVQMGIALWALYCKKQPPIIRKPAVYAAALEYFLHKWFKPWDASTQADIARKYGVSVGNVSARYGDMEVVLAEELDEFLKEVYEAPEDTGKLLPSPPSRMSQEQLLWDIKALAEEREFDSVEELNRYINAEINRPFGLKKTNSNAKQVQARELLYQAWDEAGSKRYELARRALELYPNSPDAYVILSEQAASTEAAKSLLYQGIKAGVEDLGQAYFEENKGHFWGLLETRPFMRAKLNYAFCLWDLGEHAEAIRHYEELLSLNPNDNQGVRYELLPAYIETGRYREARELIGKYHDGTANILFNQVLLEYLTSGVTEKTSRHLQEAVNQNPHVMKYLLKKKRIPRERPEYIGIGDELEAIAYVQEHARLWWREHALMDFIRRFDRGQARL